MSEYKLASARAQMVVAVEVAGIGQMTLGLNVARQLRDQLAEQLEAVDALLEQMPSLIVDEKDA